MGLLHLMRANLGISLFIYLSKLTQLKFLNVNSFHPVIAVDTMLVLCFLFSIFCFISSIEGELVLKAGDKVTYRTVPLPPKCVEKQAVEVVITAANGPHETWSPLSHSLMSSH